MHRVCVRIWCQDSVNQLTSWSFLEGLPLTFFEEMYYAKNSVSTARSIFGWHDDRTSNEPSLFEHNKHFWHAELDDFHYLEEFLGREGKKKISLIVHAIVLNNICRAMFHSKLR